jgi:uncharacterized membrane protein
MLVAAITFMVILTTIVFTMIAVSTGNVIVASHIATTQANHY